MKKGLWVGLLMIIMLPVKAQKAVIEESVTDIVCDGPTHVIAHYKEIVTVLNPQGASLANFACSCSNKDKLTSFKGQVTDANGRIIRKLKESELPITMTSYSPCFRKEVGAHGIEERGVYRIHQFEKQEMVVLCKPEDSEEWYDKMWNYSVELFRSLDIPVRNPRQKTYFEVCSCSNLTDAQARRLAIRYKKEDGEKEFVHTLNNTVIAPPRMLIAFLENNLQEDGSVLIPKVLQPYMGGKEKLIPNK